MITFDDLVKTKSELNGAREIQKEINNLKSAFQYEQDINRHQMEQLNKLLGKYFREEKKAIIHTYQNINGWSGRNSTLQLSKSGIGKTSGWREQIEVFSNLLADKSYYETKGLIGDVITKDELHNKTLSHLSEHGKTILNAVKEVYENTKITVPKETIIKNELNISKAEQSIFNNKKLYFTINDEYDNIRIIISGNNGEIFIINSIDNTEEHDFIKYLLIQNHIKEIKDIINEYNEKTKVDKEKWNQFNIQLNEKIAKYILVGMI
jgi:hypothetical protein